MFSFMNKYHSYLIFLKLKSYRDIYPFPALHSACHIMCSNNYSDKIIEQQEEWKFAFKSAFFRWRQESTWAHNKSIKPVKHAYRQFNPELPGRGRGPVGVEDVVGGPVVFPDWTRQDLVAEAPGCQPDIGNRWEKYPHVIRSWKQKQQC